MTGIVGPLQPGHLLSAPLAVERPLCQHRLRPRDRRLYLPYFFPTIRLQEEPSIIFSKRRARTEARQGRSGFLYAQPRMRDIFAAKLRLTRHFFSLERNHARALNELTGLGTFVSFLFFSFVFPCLCTY